MFKTNEYFEGNVKSISFDTKTLPATVGVMHAGEYEFSTSQKEYMTVISGSMEVLLPQETSWKSITQGESFTVDANFTFKVKTNSDTAYLCLYE